MGQQTCTDRRPELFQQLPGSKGEVEGEAFTKEAAAHSSFIAEAIATERGMKKSTVAETGTSTVAVVVGSLENIEKMFNCKLQYQNAGGRRKGLEVKQLL